MSPDRRSSGLPAISLRRRLCLGALSLVFSASIAYGQLSSGGTPVPDPVLFPGTDKPNIVIILTDDQRWDTLWAMPLVRKKLIARGVTFTNAIVASAVCCPTRASIFSGGFYAKNTGVLKNAVDQDPAVPLNGEIEYFKDDDTLATALQGAGYQTMLAGKYLNGYWRVAPYVPPGWSRFVGAVSSSANDWFNYRHVVGSSTPAQSGSGILVMAERQYVTEYQQNQILDFLDQVGASPFFILFAPAAPHHPAVPAPGDETLFSGYTYRARGYGEADLSDKPDWVVNPGRIRWAKNPFYLDPAGNDEFHRNQLRSLQAVDRAVGAIVDRIEQLGQLDRTVFVFTSDSGVTWGEHGLYEKGMAYDEVIRTPLVIRMPGVAPRAEDAMVAADLDVPATALALAGVNRSSDGVSLLPLLGNTGAAGREELLIQSWGYREGPLGGWSALRTRDWKLVEHAGGAKELYDLRNDPFELESRHSDPGAQPVLTDLQQRLDAVKGLASTTFTLPGARLGVPYSASVRTSGGAAPYRWTAVSRKAVLLCANRKAVVSPVALQSVQPCLTGTPVYDRKTEAGLFVWKDGTPRWHLRATAGSGVSTYKGRLRSSMAFTSLVPVGLEPEDSVELSKPEEIRFSLSMQQGSQDGFYFAVPPGAYVSLVVDDTLPEGLLLNETTGVISGIPTKALSTTINILVEDSSLTTFTGLPQRYVVPYIFRVVP